MGLSGRKAKQRIGKDPRNLAWADDASRFGQAYLAKFGWDSSKGLGTSGEGRTSAIKTSQKLDMLGIGMQHQNNPDGIAWRQNRDFENLLRRLNGGTNDADAIGSFHKARELESLGGEEEAVRGSGSLEKAMDGENDDVDERDVRTAKKEKKGKKEKRKAAEDEDEDKKERKKRKKSRDGSDESLAAPESTPPSKAPAHESGPGSTPMPAVAAATATATATTAAPVPVRAPPRTHRARIIAAKRMAGSNSTALAEILGIASSSASSSSTHPSAAATPFRTPTPVPDLAAVPATAAVAEAEAEAPLQRLTTSAQSVADYFKAKLGAKMNMNGALWPSSASAAARTGAGAGASARDDGSGGDRDGRAGLGLRGGGVSRERLLLTDRLDGEQVRGGIGASSLSSSRLAAMFMPGQCATPVAREEDAAAGEVDELVVTRDDASDGQEDERNRKRRGEKKRAKEERRKEKEERRRKRAEAGQVGGAVVVDPPAGGTTKKKCREPEAPDGYLEEAHSPGADGMEAIPATKKQKGGNKDKKSAKHRRPEE